MCSYQTKKYYMVKDKNIRSGSFVIDSGDIVPSPLMSNMEKVHYTIYNILHHSLLDKIVNYNCQAGEIEMILHLLTKIH